MAKFYTDKAPTPVFAVTFVSNREGIIPKTNDNTIINKDKEKNLKEIADLNTQIASLEKERERILQSENSTGFALDAVNKGILDANDKLKELGGFSSSTSTKDVEYLIYSNLQIQKTDDPNDLSQQSNWYLREAEVELTRDWPIQKAKLIVTCKLLDNGSIPPLVEVEKGFVWEKDKDSFVKLLPEGRFLSADDEVRIYAGYKNDQYISMNDLDKYPFNFTNLETTGNIPADSQNGIRLKELEAEKKAIENAIETLKNSFTDIPGLAVVAIGVIIAAFGGYALLTGSPAAGTGVVGTATTATTVGTTTTANVPLGLPVPARILAEQAAQKAATEAAKKQALEAAIAAAGRRQALDQAQLAVKAELTGTSTVQAYTTTFTPAQSLAYKTAFDLAVKGGLGTTAALSAALAAASNTLAAESKPLPSISKAIQRDYLEGRKSFDSNKELFEQLNLELSATTLLIQVLQKKAGVAIKDYKSDPNKIAPIFWGFIDSVDFISNSNAGVQIIYNLRDRSRILADTKLVTLPFLGTDANNKNTFEGLKHKTVESVYRASNGGIYLDNSFKSASSMAWRTGFEKGEVISLYEDKDKKIIDTKSALANERLKFTAAIEDPARWVIANAFLSTSDVKRKELNNFDPLFHTWTLQPPLVSGSANNTMQIINKSPFEILNYLAMTEVMPIDIFTSHINGHFMFAPRILDTSGLYDEQRGNRLYYFFDCFDELPAQRSLIKDIRVQTSTIGVYNRFTVLTADFGSSTNASLSGLTSIVDIASANTKNRKIPIKQHVIVDPKIKSNEGNKEGAAQALALTTASTMARDNTTIIFKIIGDSSFYPGEAVRVYNTVLHSKGTFTFNATSTSTAVFLKSLYDKVQQLTAKGGAIKQQGDNNKVVNLDAIIDDMRKVAGAPSDDLNDALPMYKVRAITHSLKANGNDAGYTTKIVAIADIL